VIVLTDEAHRTQYDTLAMNMRSALPNALFLAFTGTPLIAGEERTRDVFGDYVSIYDFQQSVEDGATVPLFYENRTPELHLENPNLNECTTRSGSTGRKSGTEWSWRLSVRGRRRRNEASSRLG
jgi:type I restriction enzyme R subunit